MSDVDFRLDGRRAVVTGAARGIGRAIAERLARAGAEVLVADRDEAEGAATAKAIAGAGGKAAFIALDVTDTASIDAASDMPNMPSTGPNPASGLDGTCE